MSNTSWETLSNQAVAVCGVVYFLALISHLVEWSALRRLPVSAGSVTVRERRSDSGSVALADGGPADEVAVDEDVERRTNLFGRLGLLLTVLALAVHFVALLGRGMAADPNRVPWGNMYEFTLAGTFFVTFSYLVLYKRFSLSWMAPIITGVVLVLLMVDVTVLHEEVAPLSEALDSPWLVIHVVSAVIATGAFTVGGIVSLLFLAQERAERRGRRGGYLSRVPDTATLDRVAYRINAFAFPVWTFAVLITGPIWAFHAWGSYWNWDPKEVWAFITWVLYAGYLHARATAGWKGRNAAILALTGMVTLWFSFIGVNFFVSGSSHTYAQGLGQSSVVSTDL